MRLFEAAHVVAGAEPAALAGGAVAVEADRVRMVGAADELRRAFPDAERLALGDAVLMPGFVNAHQHGRGLSQIQLGYRDDALEPWIAARQGRGAPDTYSLTRLAALEMLANGVTSTLHANYSYGSGDYESELRGSIRAYEEAGLRATVCVGFADRGRLVYPPEDPADVSGPAQSGGEPALRGIIETGLSAVGRSDHGPDGASSEGIRRPSDHFLRLRARRSAMGQR